MPGGKGNIKPSDGKPFEKGNKAAEKWTESEALKLANDLIVWQKSDNQNIFIGDFLFLSCDEKKYSGKIYPDLICYLSEKFTTFSELIKKSKEIEKSKLIKFGVFDKLNPQMTKFVLACNHGMTEKQTIDLKNDGGKFDNQVTIFQLPDDGRNN